MQAVANLTKFLEASVQMEPHLTVISDLFASLVAGGSGGVCVVVLRHGINLLSDVASISRHGLP
ncbi:MAG: hypothetical protein Ct9H300mP12_12580 [Acidimicrobiales bacterium]|nr:MAG: hypothetical protein Ct9H300mP12_12580 [Acidimicrobiales bacterium]